jgi:hypothetical protein
MTSVGPSITGSTDWTLLSGQLTMPEDTVDRQLHLTMQHCGTVWHDDVAVLEIAPGTVAGIEGEPAPTAEELAVWQVPAVVKVFQDDPAASRQGPIQISAARGWGHPPKAVFGQRPFAGDPPYESEDHTRLRAEYVQVYQEMLRLFWNHLKQKGWERRVVLYISDEPFDQHEHIQQQMRALCDMIDDVDPEIPVYSSTWKHVPKWDGYLDVWGIGHDGRVTAEKMEQLQAAGDRIWFTTDGQMCTDTPYVAVERLLPHYCFKYGAEAYEFWGVGWLTYDPFRFGWHSFIHQSSEPGKSYWIRYPNGDGFLLYPGKPVGHEGAMSSVRFEQAREGVEDYEYLYLLQQLIGKAKADGKDVTGAEQALNKARDLVDIPNAGGYYSTKILPDPDRLYAVRRDLATAIESLLR